MELRGRRRAKKPQSGFFRRHYCTLSSSGRGYYEQDGNVLICQDRGKRFAMDQVEIESGGCKPWPVFPENKTAADDAFSISCDYLNGVAQSPIGKRIPDIGILTNTPVGYILQIPLWSILRLKGVQDGTSGMLLSQDQRAL